MERLIFIFCETISDIKIKQVINFFFKSTGKLWRFYNGILDLDHYSDND